MAHRKTNTSTWIVLVLLLFTCGVMFDDSCCSTGFPRARSTPRSTTPNAPPANQSPPPRAAPAQRATAILNGYDAAAGVTVQSINLWAAANRVGGVVGAARHGSQVQLIDHVPGDPSMYLVETSSGLRGWVSELFVSPN